MLADARKIPAGTRLEADLCVIGAGAAGMAIAREFVGTATRVIVLESGDVDFDAQTQSLAHGESVGLPYFPLDTARLRWLGGTTNHWGGVCRVMEKADFEGKPWAGIPSWPIRLRDVEPYYERARILCGVESPEWRLENWLTKDRTDPFPLDREQIVSRVAQIVAPAARSFRKKYAADLERSPNVIVQRRANVTEIETDATGSQVRLVRASTLAGNRFSVAARRVVLAAGGIDNARILLASNRHRPAGVGNEHDQVGRYFLEHPRFVGGILVPSNPKLPTRFYEHHRVGQAKLKGYLSLSEARRRAERLVDVQVSPRVIYLGSFNSARSSDEVRIAHQLMRGAKRRDQADGLRQHIAHLVSDLTTWRSFVVPGAPLPVPFPEVVGTIMRSTPVEAQALVPDLVGDVAGMAYARTFGAPIESIRLVTRIEPVPNADSRVTLAPERDPTGMPRVRLDWRLSPIDHHSVRRTLEILGTEVGRAGLGRVQIVLGEDDRVWPEDLAGGYHLIGTTRMSDDPRSGVVDRHCRVHGVNNLFIAGSSVFTTAGAGTPTLTLVALALRLVDHLKGVPA